MASSCLPGLSQEQVGPCGCGTSEGTAQRCLDGKVQEAKGLRDLKPRLQKRQTRAITVRVPQRVPFASSQVFLGGLGQGKIESPWRLA